MAEKVISVIGVAAFVLFNLILTMFTISTLWGWFVVPLGAPVIGWAQAYGFALIASYIAVRNSPKFADGILKKQGMAERMGNSIGWNAIVLLFGFIATLFM